MLAGAEITEEARAAAERLMRAAVGMTAIARAAKAHAMSSRMKARRSAE